MTGLAPSLGVLGVPSTEFILSAVEGLRTGIGAINFLEVVLFNKGNESVFHFHEDSPDRSD
jgi:hypothetical protein